MDIEPFGDLSICSAYRAARSHHATNGPEHLQSGIQKPMAIVGHWSTTVGCFLEALEALRSCPASFKAEAGLRWCGASREPKEDLMSKSAKKRAARLPRASRSAAERAPKSAQSKGPRHKPAQLKPAAPQDRSAESTRRKVKTDASKSGSKQARVLALLRAPNGATITAIMQATGWQQHSVRGFLAGVVRNRLKLNLTSNEVDGRRVYRITDSEDGRATKARDATRAA
jgi:Protein of unknown function (DUF3489)